ncbi:helix-turn-helix domain-containing protein [Novosphingobium sp. LASN5T]|uniref:helix-turn-helix domain-containing protein n=1 Tax=Novosphingobium sp. LASN5T TaxID=2491021 RepID=UPI000F5EA086|nr:helix-turn-helix domain-containing protein [Novosphingobium sp. LASN5T]RQW39447.1 transcriptional regulator [Novosphingobium sp. LASN5T]
MSSQASSQSDEGPILHRIKVTSGWCIEEKRRRSRLSQEALADDVGITVRWLREIEGGNPRATIEDHLRCAASLGLATGYLLILILFVERQMNFPRELLLDDLSELEERCVSSIAEYSVKRLAKRLGLSGRRDIGPD